MSNEIGRRWMAAACVGIALLLIYFGQARRAGAQAPPPPPPPPPRSMERPPMHEPADPAPPATRPTIVDPDGTRHVPILFSGGYETDPRDGGRPVILIAAGLNVPADVFRTAFTGVHPAGPGSGGPTQQEAQANKRALLSVLSPYGVTNDRLDEVSNFYRYNRSAGQLWRHSPAIADALIRSGKLVGFTLLEPGYGYTSPPAAAIPDLLDLHPVVKLKFTTDLQKNGSIEAIDIGPGKSPTSRQ